jgi:hypothetical protein
MAWVLNTMIVLKKVILWREYSNIKIEMERKIQLVNSNKQNHKILIKKTKSHQEVRQLGLHFQEVIVACQLQNKYVSKS